MLDDVGFPALGGTMFAVGGGVFYLAGLSLLAARTWWAVEGAG